MIGHDGLIAAIDALRANIAILDHTGTIVAVNERWRRFGMARDATSDCIGLNYISVCKEAGKGGDRSAERVAAGLDRLLNGATTYGHAYICADRAFRLSARHLGHPAGAVIVAHEDITSLVKAKRDRNRSSRALGTAEHNHIAELRRGREEIGQRLLAITLAAHALEEGGNSANALALIRLAVDEARHELQTWR